jgi:hypothetical protein
MNFNISWTDTIARVVKTHLAEKKTKSLCSKNSEKDGRVMGFSLLERYPDILADKVEKSSKFTNAKVDDLDYRSSNSFFTKEYINRIKTILVLNGGKPMTHREKKKITTTII